MVHRWWTVGWMTCLIACGDDDRAPGPTTDGGSGCRGTPTPCELLELENCLSSIGCEEADECTGTPNSCSMHFSSGTCDDQQGCSWDGATCIGVATPCGNFFDFSDCLGQGGCRTEYSCEGVREPCESTPLTVCFESSTPGCTSL
jgi:hypothetical protein